MLPPSVACVMIVVSLVPIILYVGYDFGRYCERRRQHREVDAALEQYFDWLASKGGET